MDIEEIRQLRELMSDNSTSNEILTEIRTALSPRHRHWTEYITSLSGFILAIMALFGVGSKAYLELRGDLDTLMHSKAAIELEVSRLSVRVAESSKDIKAINETIIEYRVKEELKGGK